MRIVVKNFEDLTTDELYTILQLRAEVFVVEQDCAYQDLDGKDQKAKHIMGYNNGDIVAYTRIFAGGDNLEKASIGRVVVKKDQRTFGYGKDIMLGSIAAIENNFGTREIEISAQTYLSKFYHELGFTAVGEEYPEDGIPHISMIKTQ